MTRSTGPDARIVVGVNGSPASKAALNWAIRQGACTGAVVEAVIAYYWFPMPVEAIDFRVLARRLVDEAIFEAADPGTPVKIVPKVVHGSPAKALLQEAADADLLVVGRRGHGAVSEALLGSVSHQCVLHAACPVVVVREPGARAH
jgi:nucleotide-binding universal stress UspA family protein